MRAHIIQILATSLAPCIIASKMPETVVLNWFAIVRQGERPRKVLVQWMQIGLTQSTTGVVRSEFSNQVVYPAQLWFDKQVLIGDADAQAGLDRPTELSSDSHTSSGLVFIGGGARGLSHARVLRELVVRGYVLSDIVGTPLRAVVGATYAISSHW